MTPEKTITICGQSVKLIYCAATETGYERLSGKETTIFTPTTETDEEGKEVTIPAAAQMGDFITLGIAAIVAAYSRDGKEPPISSEEILYDATPEEVTELITAVIELRMKWYHVSPVVKEEMKTEEGSSPNA